MQPDALTAYLNNGVTSLIMLNGKAPVEINWVQWVDIMPGLNRKQQLLNHTGNIGWAIPKGLVVLDCDTQQDASLMKEWLDKSQLRYLYQQTAKGAHYVLRHSLSQSVANSVRMQFGGVALDLRGHGGQIVVWPSIHQTGFKYCWIIPPWKEGGLNSISELPSHFFQQLIRPAKPQEDYHEAPVLLLQGQRNDNLFKMGSSMRSQGFGDEAITTALNEHNRNYCSPSLSQSEINTIVKQVLKYDAGQQFSVSKNIAERPLTHDALGRLPRYIQLAHQIKRYGQDRQHALDTLHKCAHETDENYVMEAVQLVYGDETEQDVEVHSPSSSLAEYRELLMKRGQYSEPELPTGFSKIDHLLWGVRRGEIITIGARPGVGKTSLIIGAAHHLCSKGKKVLYMSTETTFEGVFNRVVAVGANIPTFNLESGQLTEEDKRRFEQYVSVFQKQNLLVCDMSQPSIEMVRHTVNKHKPDVLVIDHIQHVATDADNIYRELSRFVKGLKDTARETQCAVLLASQLNRLAAGEIPTLAHLKECGTIEEESHAVLLLYKPEENPNSMEDQVICIVAKNRGPKGHVVMTFYKLSTRFIER